MAKNLGQYKIENYDSTKIYKIYIKYIIYIKKVIREKSFLIKENIEVQSWKLNRCF